MNLVDVFILLLLGSAVFYGLRQGAAVQVFSFGGFWIGLLIGAALAPALSGLGSSPAATSLISLGTFLGAATLGGSLGRTAGTHAFGFLRRLQLGSVDSALGAGVSAVGTLFAVWLFALLIAASPALALNSAVHESVIVRALEERLPNAPSIFSRLRELLDTSGFPQVFVGLEPVAPETFPLPDDPAIRAAVEAADQSTVKVFGSGCGGIQTGSGFVAGNGVVVTNAHVIAGIDSVVVQDSAGRHSATPVAFDPNLDIAVLRTSRLAGGALALFTNPAARGTPGAVLGFPGGGPFRAGPGVVLRQFTATGRDIYGRGVTQRSVYQLRAEVRPGNSGGPFVDQSGRVNGVIFASSSTEGDVGYAITSAQVVPRVNQSGTREVDTGPCT